MSDLMKGRASSSSEFVQDKKYEVYLGKKEKKNMVCPTSQLVQEETDTGQKNEKLNLGKIEKNNGENSLADLISGMPDEILVSILSLLPLKEAAATSALSRRWQCVWMSTMTLNFDVNFHLHRNRLRFRHSGTKLQHLESCRYVNWVDHVVEQHRGPIKQFRACFGLDGQFTSSIDKWIQFAMKKGVEILELDFFLNRGVAAENLYMFPGKPLGLGKEHLYPYTPNLHSCGYDIGFKFLKVLHFRSVDVTDDVLEYLLSNCPGLERLAVHRTKSLVNVRVGGSSVALKYLVGEHCLHLKSIEICDANLVSFIYKGQEINLVLSNVPFLVEVSISADPTSIDLPFTQLSCCLPQLETLMLDICEVYYNQKRAFPISENLKHLELIVEADHRWALHHLTYFLKAFPCLQRLAVKLDYSDPKGGVGKVKKASACPHHCLKVVEIIGYRGRESAVKHVLYLIKSLVAPEKIIIDPVQLFEYPVERYPSGIDRGVEVVDEEEEIMLVILGFEFDVLKLNGTI
ncbi:putative F-box/LRR-repeat protein At3g58880 [Prunus dulcis]|uniref:putative F-box/LRR-repeat protein At3g58880 n=1 Tax=Prunus dulcis TaxID=3755 RepID=UPI001482892B|nr:putative F-box/LRR-repeat protein At3g58880 [Prunus dulcis]